jgi:GAF domain-containing protein/HAMP domain-containing protein
VAINLTLNETFQLIAWVLAMVEFIVALYVLLLNARHASNQHVSVFFLALAISTYATGAMVGAANADQARLASILQATVAPISGPLVVIMVMLLLKPAWREGKLNWTSQALYILAALSLLLVTSDLALGTKLYFTGLEADYPGGYAALSQYTAGALGRIIVIINMYVFQIGVVALLAYLAFLDKAGSEQNRRLALVLLVTQLIVLGLNVLHAVPGFPGSVTIVLTNLVFVVGYSFAGFQQMLSERSEQSGSLQFRLTGLIVAISVPFLIISMLIITDQAGQQLRRDAGLQMQAHWYATTENLTLWREANVRALKALANQPGIISMDPAQQKPILEAMASNFPEMYLVSTTNLQGVNVARNDDLAPVDYNDRAWFKQAAAGAELTTQVVVGRTGGAPAIIFSVPIRDAEDKIIGVAMFASRLNTIAISAQALRVGESGIAYVVDEADQVIVHSDRQYVETLTNFGEGQDNPNSYPPVVALRQGERSVNAQGQSELYAFTDAEGVRWLVYMDEMDNGWGVFVQQSENELMAALKRFQATNLLVLGVGAVLLGLLVWATVRQSLLPIKSLTVTAQAASAGNLAVEAPVESRDEIGLLAQTFNGMTKQLRETISGLEQRIEERTRDTERRALQLRVASEVARDATAIRDLRQLLSITTQLISNRFNFYHAGIFLVDEANEYAILQAANSEGGQRMLARGHRLKVGRVGIVGYVAATGDPRIALDVGEDATFFNNPDLPQTRSEMAVPLKARNRVIGILDVQSVEASAFGQDDIEIMQVLADQVALAIENARLFEETQQTVHELEQLYGQQTRQAWQQRLGAQSLAFAYNRLGVTPADQSIIARHNETTADQAEATAGQLSVPITVRDQQIGTISLRRDPDQPAWTEEEQETLAEAVTQISQALETARLLEEIRFRAEQERMIGQITSRAQSSLDLETVMKTTVQEIGAALNASRVQLRLSGSQDEPAAQATRKGAE